LVGIGNAISDGYLVVYYPLILVHPNYQGNGIGQKMMHALQTPKQSNFIKKLGFERADQTVPMLIYSGMEH
jgi:N-acetylglutamate synthase-like GNAT family acetyltransferase